MDSTIGRTIRGGFGFLTADILTRGLGFGFTVLAGWLLGPEEFGVLALGLSVMGIARQFAVFGFPTTAQRFLSGSVPDEGRRIYGAILVLGALGASLTAGLFFLSTSHIASFFQESRLVPVLNVLTLAVISGSAVFLLRGTLQAQEKVQQIVVVDALQGAAKVGVLIPLAIWFQRAEDAAWAVVCAFTIAAMMAGKYVWNLDLRPDFRAFAQSARKALTYSAPLVVAGLGYLLAEQTDRLMLGWLSTSAAVGVYAVTAKLAMVMGTLHGALVSIFKPIASEAYREGAIDQMRDAYRFVSKWVGATNGIALLAFAGVGPWLLQVLGSEYATSESYTVLVILASLYFIGTWVGPTGALLQMADGHRVELVNTIVFVVVNTALNYLLITEFGLVGAAAATLISGVLRNALQIIQIAYWHDITPFARPNLIVLGISVSAVVLTLLASSAVLRLAFAVVGALSIGGFVLWTATDEERATVRGLISRRSG